MPLTKTKRQLYIKRQLALLEDTRKEYYTDNWRPKKTRAVMPRNAERGGGLECCYCTSDGRKCAVGRLMNDAEIAKATKAQLSGYASIECVARLHRRLAQSLVKRLGLSNSWECGVELLNDLQQLHDDNGNAPGTYIETKEKIMEGRYIK